MLPLLVVLAAELFIGIPPPFISITAWQATEQFLWNTNEDPPLTEVVEAKTRESRSYAVPGNVAGLRIRCNASYPIQWDFVTEKYRRNGALKLQMDQLTQSTRKADDIFNNATFEYISELRLHGDENTLTGNYTCRSTDDPDVIFSNVYLFWEGNSPPYILRNGENSSVYILPDTVLPTVVLPCLVSVPTVSVLLEKQVIDTWTRMELNANHWTYNPSVGFQSRHLDTNEVTGSYRCFTESHNDDERFFDVVLGPDPTKINREEMMLNNASFSYHEENHKFVCCSNSWRQPAFQLFHCENPTLCRATRLSLDTFENTKINHGKRVSNWYGSCSSIKIVYQTSGVLKCVGDGIRIYREYFFEETLGIARLVHHNKYKIPIGIQGSPYYHWSDANPERMISVKPEKSRPFAGENVRIACQASTYYFAEGIKWLIKWKNNSQEVQEGTENTFLLQSALFLHPGYSYLDVIVDANISSIACYAPVWNSSEWFYQSIQLEIVEPVAPTIDGSLTSEKVEQISWYLNDTGKYLKCHVEGTPWPTVLWEHNDRILNESRQANGTSFLEISKVSFANHGNYICTAQNLAGTQRKIFQVSIQEKMSTGQKTGLAFTVIAAIAFVIVLGILIRHVKSQSNSILHLKKIAFKDVMDGDRRPSRSDEAGQGHISFPFPSSPSEPMTVADLEAVSSGNIDRNCYPKFNLPAANQTVVYEKF